MLAIGGLAIVQMDIYEKHGTVLYLYYIHAILVKDTHEELRQVSEQLELVEQQLTALLEQQEQLLRKKKLLQAAIKSASSTVLDDTNWRKEGKCESGSV